MSDVYLNGDFLAADQAKISVFDRGFLLGDGVYEVIPVYNGHSFQLSNHLARLQASLDGVKMKNPLSTLEWQSMIAQLIERNGCGDQSLYLQVTRGVAARDHVFPKGVTPTVFAMSNPLLSLPENYKKQGIAAITLSDIRWQNCNIKAISLLANSLLKQQALEAGAQEALLIRDGYLTEGAASNAYVVINGTIYTSPKDTTILPGITRQVLISLANNAAIPLIEKAVTTTQLQQADEVWVSSSTREILPITELDGDSVGKGVPGPLWQQIDKLYQHYKEDVAAWQ